MRSRCAGGARHRCRTHVVRTHQNRSPPSRQELFIDGYIFKFLLFGLIHGMLMVTVLLLLAANSLVRSYRAIDAPAHITIEGGVAGNAAMAALFVVLAIVSWWLLNRRSD